MASSFLTIPEVAEQIGMTKVHLYKLVQRGKIPCYRFSERNIRLRLDEVAAAVHSGKAVTRKRRGGAVS